MIVQGSLNYTTSGRRRKKLPKTKKRISRERYVPKKSTREEPQYPSVTSNVADTSRKERSYYTGKNLLGIGTLHKSNLVPVFNEEDAKDMSNMRRNVHRG
jgi:hypothetical protein